MIRVNLIGRFGNNCFQYARARAVAESRGEPLSYSPWIGQKIFDLPEPAEDAVDSEIMVGYCQDQASLIYTRTQAKAWLRFRPEIQDKLSKLPTWNIVAHRRAGDYESLGYPVVSVKSYMDAAREHGIETSSMIFCSEENYRMYCCPPDLPDEISFLSDFYRMMQAKVLFRGNSSFSWWASVLGNAETFSPRIDGLSGHCHARFERGNHARFCNLDFVTDLHLTP